MAWLRDSYPQAVFVAPPSRAAALDELKDADAIVGSISNAEFVAAERVEWIHATSAGVEFLWVG